MRNFTVHSCWSRGRLRRWYNTSLFPCVQDTTGDTPERQNLPVLKTWNSMIRNVAVLSCWSWGRCRRRLRKGDNSERHCSPLLIERSLKARTGQVTVRLRLMPADGTHEKNWWQNARVVGPDGEWCWRWHSEQLGEGPTVRKVTLVYAQSQCSVISVLFLTGLVFLKVSSTAETSNNSSLC